MTLYKIIVFFWIFLGTCGNLEALAPVSNRTEVQYTKKKEQKVRKRLPKSGSPGMAYIYIFFFLAFGIVVSIGLVLSLIFSWTIASWIFGGILALQLLIAAFFLVSVN